MTCAGSVATNRTAAATSSGLRILARCSSAVTFSVSLLSSSGTAYTFSHIFSIPANQWTLCQLSSIPIWPAAATWPTTPGSQGYALFIGLAAGSTYTSPSNDSWITGGYTAGLGTSNFLNLPVNTVFSVAYISHVPGPDALILDKPFTQNLDECERYYCKSYNYGDKGGTPAGNVCAMTSQGNTDVGGWIPWAKRMAKTPTQIIIWNHATGSANSIQTRGGTNIAVTGINNIGETGFAAMILASAPGVNIPCYFHYTADTGW